jgi:predicted porin
VPARSYQSAGAAVAYTIGDATVALTGSNIRFGNSGDLSSGPNRNHYTGTAVFNYTEISLRYRPRPAVPLGAAYNYTDGNGVNANPGAKYHQGELSAQYIPVQAHDGLRDRRVPACVRSSEL